MAIFGRTDGQALLLSCVVASKKELIPKQITEKPHKTVSTMYSLLSYPRPLSCCEKGFTKEKHHSLPNKVTFLFYSLTQLFLLFPIFLIFYFFWFAPYHLEKIRAEPIISVPNISVGGGAVKTSSTTGDGPRMPPGTHRIAARGILIHGSKYCPFSDKNQCDDPKLCDDFLLLTRRQ